MQYLDQSDSRLKLVLKVTNTSLWEWNFQTGQVAWSENLEQLWDLDPGTQLATYQDLLKQILPSDRRLVKQAIIRAIRQQTKYRIEFRIRHADNTIHWLVCQGEVDSDENQKPVKILGILSNITPDKQAQTAVPSTEFKFLPPITCQTPDRDPVLATNKLPATSYPKSIPNQLALGTIEAKLSLWESLIQISSDLITILSVNGIILYQSPASKNLLGYTPEELVGQVIFKYIAPQEESAITQALKNLINAGHQATFPPMVLHLLCKDGTWRSLEVSGINLLADKAVGGIVINARDATKRLQVLRELKNTQDQLVQIDKMASLGQLVAGVAHEINDPVSFISGNIIYACEYVENLLKIVKLYREYYAKTEPVIEAEIEKIDLDFLIEDLPKLLKSMKVGADRIHQIVLSLRSISRPDEAQMKSVDIHQGIEDTLMILHNRLKARTGTPKIQIIKNYAQLPLIECHPGQLNQVFMNLIGNAIDALEEAKTISLQRPKDTSCSLPFIQITTEVRDDNRVVIRIADNGVGMTEQVKQKIFECFFSTKPDTGNGLGLWISYNIIVDKHHGQLYCYSVPGEGTQFVIDIPIRHSCLEKRE